MIDEFQRVNKIPSLLQSLQVTLLYEGDLNISAHILFKEEFDTRTKSFKGVFLCFGSVASELEHIVFGPGSPLFSRGFHRINLNALSVYEIFKFLEQFQLPSHILLLLYTAIDGVIGNYEELFKVMFLVGLTNKLMFSSDWIVE